MNTATARRTMALALALLAASALAAQEKRSALDKVGDTAESVAEQPLKDLNLMKARIAPELAAISDAPYSLAGIRTCPQFATAIGTMTRVLGPDLDSAAARNSRGETPAEFALGAGATVAGSFIPGGGLIRKLSGAEKQQKRAAAAVLSGQVRRAFLKGTARAKGCRV